MHRGALVAHVRDLEPRIQRGVVNRHDVVAGQREQLARARLGQRAGENVGATQPGHARSGRPAKVRRQKSEG
ncbi:hypothetical protein D3C83_76910 [compost metagenome]